MERRSLQTLELKLWVLSLFLILGLLWVEGDIPSYAQKIPKTLTLLYSNNINGEIEPCPT